MVTEISIFKNKSERINCEFTMSIMPSHPKLEIYHHVDTKIVMEYLSEYYGGEVRGCTENLGLSKVCRKLVL